LSYIHAKHEISVVFIRKARNEELCKRMRSIALSPRIIILHVWIIKNENEHSTRKDCV